MSADESRPSRRGRRGLLILIVVGLAALAANSDLRTRLLDVLFGAEEEFMYSAPTEPSLAS